MSKNHHCAVAYYTLEQLLEGCGVNEETNPQWYQWAKRHWTKRWKQHVERNGNVPFVLQCDICSGKEHRIDIKLGRWKEARPSKVVRDETNPKKIPVDND